MADTANNIFSDDYDHIAEVGSGGTARVFLARKQGCLLPVALKLFNDADSEALIRREVEIAGRIKFPGLVRVKNKGLARDGRRFLELEYCSGPGLDRLAGRVGEEKLLSILSAVSCTLYVIHRAGYVYNDLKPSNIFCPPRFDSDDFELNRLFYLKLSDFSLSSRLTDEGPAGATGTVGYMSPEMILKRKVTPASDLFSLGIMAYYLACGEMPFTAEDNDPVNINSQITEGKRPQFIGGGRDLSDGLKNLIYKLLAIEPEKRGGSAFDLTIELARLSSPYPFRKAVRPRHLMGHYEAINAEALITIFGSGCFSDKQLLALETMTGFEFKNMSLLLDYNFEIGNFARLDNRWGWRDDSAKSIIWPKRLSRLNLKLLRGKPLSFKLLNIALAVVGSDAELFDLVNLFSDDPDDLVALWHQVPNECRPALIHSVDRSISSTSRRIISRRLIPQYENNEKHTALLGRLYFNAGLYAEAVSALTTGAWYAFKKSRNDAAFELLDLAYEAALRLDEIDPRAEVALDKARMHKELGLIRDAEEQYRQALELIGQTNRKEMLAQAYKELGDVYKVKSDYNSGIEVLNKALAIYREIDDQLELSHTLNNLGNIYWMAGELEKAVDYYHQALGIQEQLNSTKDIASSLSNIGTIHVVRGEYEDGVSYLDRSLKIKETLGDKREVARTLNNLGVAHFLSGKMSPAIEVYLRSLELNRDISDRHEQLLNIENLAEAMTQAGRVKDALGYIKDGMRLAEEDKAEFHRSDLTRLTGLLLRRIGKYTEAEVELNKALDISQKLDNKSLQMVCTIGMARLRISLREFQDSEELIKQALKQAEALSDKSALFYLNLLRLDLTGDQQVERRSVELARELNSARDTAQLNLTLLERSNKLQNPEEARRYRSEAYKFFNADNEDIDQPRYDLAAGKSYYLEGNNLKANDILKEALTLAKQRALLPEQWQIQAFLSEIAFIENRFEDSFQYAQDTLNILKEISKQISDRERLGRFYNDQTIIDLLGRIKSLQSVLGNKIGAAVSNP